MRVVHSFFLCLVLVLLPHGARAQDGPPPDGTEDSPSELVVPAVPEGYAPTVRRASNADRRGPGPGERPVIPDGEDVQPARESDPEERLLMEFGGAIVAVGAGLALGYAVGLEEGEEMRTAMTLVFSYLLLPSFTWLGGSILGGGLGNWGGAFIGQLVGIGIGALFALWAMEERSEEGMYAALLIGPALGAILGIEIHHEARASRRRRQAAESENDEISVSMSVAPVRGGGMATLSGRF